MIISQCVCILRDHLVHGHGIICTWIKIEERDTGE